MQWTPEWLSAWGAVAALLLAAVSGPLGWHLRGRKEMRDAMPIIRSAWATGPKGFHCKIEVQNRINEDLHFTEARADADFAWYTYETDKGGSIWEVGGATHHSAPSPMTLDWVVGPLGTANFGLSVMGAETPQRISLKLNSSNRTLRSRTVTLRNR